MRAARLSALAHALVGQWQAVPSKKWQRRWQADWSWCPQGHAPLPMPMLTDCYVVWSCRGELMPMSPQYKSCMTDYPALSANRLCRAVVPPLQHSFTILPSRSPAAHCLLPSVLHVASSTALAMIRLLRTLLRDRLMRSCFLGTVRTCPAPLGHARAKDDCAAHLLKARG